MLNILHYARDGHAITPNPFTPTLLFSLHISCNSNFHRRAYRSGHFRFGRLPQWRSRLGLLRSSLFKKGPGNVLCCCYAALYGSHVIHGNACWKWDAITPRESYVSVIITAVVDISQADALAWYFLNLIG